MADDQNRGWKDGGHGNKGPCYDPGMGGGGGMMHPCSGMIMHVIQAGDTFFNLGQRYGVCVDDILMMNPCACPTNLQIGQIVCIPCPRNDP